MLKITWPQIAAWRIKRHHLDRRAPAGNLFAVTADLCGLHAQVLSSAVLTLWARVESLEREAVHRALWEERTLVKTWAMRGTLHLLPANELPVWYGALGTSTRYLRPKAWKNYYGVSMQELDCISKAIGQAVDGCVLTREELAEKVGRITGSRKFGKKLAEGSWGTILKPAAFSGRLCFGPSKGQLVCFTHPSTWAAMPSLMDPETATREVTRRFLSAYGPATYHDLARWWGGGGVASAKKWLASLEEELSSVEVEGKQAWMLAKDVDEMREADSQRCVRLLPAFDQYVIGASRHAEHLMTGGTRNLIYRPQGWISPVLLVNGFMHGVWRHEIKGRRVEVAITPFVKAPGWLRAGAEEEAERLGGFLDCKLDVRWKHRSEP
ncbi:MAG TPA: winged helix DNA-binding domain-containing protein [Terriglobales bacterium]|nr:winged helix DNA-binding domain-containing protein [Terriglobales bacterium]